MRPHKHGHQQRGQVGPHIAIQLHQLGKQDSSCQPSGNVKEKGARGSAPSAGFPSGDHVQCEKVVHRGCTGVHQGGKGSEAFSKVAHLLGSLLPIHLSHVLSGGHSIQYADDGNEH